MGPSRRDFLRSSVSAGLLLGLDRLSSRIALGATVFSSRFGPLIPVASENTGEMLLALPAGFHYRVLRRTGDPMSDGNLTPPVPDGMAAFSASGLVRLLRNHEISDAGQRLSQEGVFYDPSAGGGVTTVEINPFTGQVVRDFVSLSGTVRNCSGGTTPWGSWISCEETTVGFGAGFARPHGYCFEVRSASNNLEPAGPLRSMGRFLHEAVAVDAGTGIVYLTEDRPQAGLYRFVPDRKGELHAGGKLQMLAIAGRSHYDTSRDQIRGVNLPVTWVDIDDPDPAEAEFNPSAVFQQGRAKGGASFARLEGATYTAGRVVFTATTGGNAGLGQIWQLRIRPARSHSVRRGIPVAAETLTLLFESSSPAVLKAPDNLCVAPGDSLVVCEDSASGSQFLRILDSGGEIHDLARNIVPGFESSEFAGATFSADGGTLFVNIYQPGLTVGITVPRGLSL